MEKGAQALPGEEGVGGWWHITSNINKLPGKGSSKFVHREWLEMMALYTYSDSIKSSLYTQMHGKSHYIFINSIPTHTASLQRQLSSL